MSGRIFLLLTGDPYRDSIHGVDYLKGLTNGDEKVVRECGRRHEFQTRQCKPVFLTEEDVEDLGYPEDEIVEAIPFREHVLDMMIRPEEEA